MIPNAVLCKCDDAMNFPQELLWFAAAPRACCNSLQGAVHSSTISFQHAQCLCICGWHLFSVCHLHFCTACIEPWIPAVTGTVLLCINSAVYGVQACNTQCLCHSNGGPARAEGGHPGWAAQWKQSRHRSMHSRHWSGCTLPDEGPLATAPHHHNLLCHSPAWSPAVCYRWVMLPFPFACSSVAAA